MTRIITLKKRSKLLRALLAPMLAVIFIVGWILYRIGAQMGQKRPQKKISKIPTNQENIQLITIAPEEEQTLTA